jgi:small ligand-binding sensory domain FIST
LATERLLAAAGAGLGLGPSPPAAAIDAALAAMASAGADHADLALVFTTGDAYPAAHELLHAVRRVTGARVVVGCSGAGVLTERREVEDEPAVAVLVVRDQRLVAKPVLVRDLADPTDVGAELARQAGATLAEGGCLLVLPVVGGVAAGTPLFELVNTEVVQGSLAGVALSGPRSIIGVAQGCVPIGEPYVITRAEGNLVMQIAGRPPLEVLREAVRATPDGAARAQRAGLFAGLAMDSAKSPLERGDFLVRNLLGADAGTGAIAVAEPVRVGQTIQFQLRDAAASREDLATTLREVARALKGQPPAFGCYFNCAGRGRGLFDVPDHDVSLIRAHLGEFPLVGFFGNGEFAPIGRRNFFHNYTGALVVFPA